MNKISKTDTVSLFAILVLVLGFDILLGVNVRDFAIPGVIGLGLILWLFYRSWGRSWNKTA